MLIKSLCLSNFRQFVDDETIIFSTDPDKKVTFIMAESGVGKTTLIQSFEWILYGTCKYKSILNEDVRNSLFPQKSAKVTGTLVINHENRDYTIIRSETFCKINKTVRSDGTNFQINYVDEDGISRQIRSNNADFVIKKMMPHDLFPYFFLEGESLTKVGEQMSKGKAGNNADFVKAIKGLLDFNFLYETKKHLKLAVDDYNNYIAQNTSNIKLTNVLNSIKTKRDTIESDNDRSANIDGEISSYTIKRDNLQDELIKYGEIQSDQENAKAISNELPTLRTSIMREEKAIFDKFSSKGFYFIANSLIDDAKEVMKNSDSMDKGIPGMNVEAINFMLKNHTCICGEELIEGSEHWKKLNELLEYLPPNSIGIEIETFYNAFKQIESEAENFNNDYLYLRGNLQNNIKMYDEKIEKLEELNKKIGGVNKDIGALKSQESYYIEKLNELAVEKKSIKEENSRLNNEISGLEYQKDVYEKEDQKTKKFQIYCGEAKDLQGRVERFIAKKEQLKRNQLTNNINEIFKNFYKEKIAFTLDSSYGVHIQTYNKELSDDFTSGGQDVAVALAFIGAIIEANKDKETKPSDDDLIDDLDKKKESYPLIMDAPTSNFGMKQMESFSNIMPKIADQIIVFINDKDGPILEKLLSSKIGQKWILSKEQGDSYRAKIEKGI